MPDGARIERLQPVSPRACGGALSPRCDERLIVRLLALVMACATCTPLRLNEGLNRYVPVGRQAFRQTVRTGKRGRPRLQLWGYPRICANARRSFTRRPDRKPSH